MAMLSPKPWRLEAIMLLLAGIFVCLMAGTLLAGLLHQAGVAGFKKEDSLGMIVLGTLSMDGAACVAGAIFLWYHQVGWREALGWRQGNFKRLIGPICGTVVVILPVALGLQLLSGAVLIKLGYVPKEQDAVELFANAHSVATMAYLIFFATVLAPVAEEFVFRGVLYPYFKQLVLPETPPGQDRKIRSMLYSLVKKIGFPRLSLFGVSLLFAAIHLDIAVILPLFVFALAQTWLYEKTDCLVAPMVTHATFNLANLLLMFFSSGLSTQPGGQS